MARVPVGHRAHVDGDLRVGGQPVGQRPYDVLRVDRLGGRARAFRGDRRATAASTPRPPRARRRSSRRFDGGRAARAASRRHRRAAAPRPGSACRAAGRRCRSARRGPARRRVELGPRVVGADSSSVSHAAHELGAGGGAEVPHARRCGTAGSRRAPACRAATRRSPAPSRSASSTISSAAPYAPWPTGWPPVRRRRAARGGVRMSSRAGTTRAGRSPGLVTMHPVLVRVRVRGRSGLHVVRQHHAGRAAGGQRGAERPVDQHRHLLGRVRRLDELRAHVAEQPDQVDLLLVAAAQHAGHLLPDDRHDRLAVQLGVVETVEQVHGAGPLGRQADADAAGVLGVPDRHERGGLLVAGLDERGLPGAPQRPDHAVDAVAGVAEHRGRRPTPVSRSTTTSDVVRASAIPAAYPLRRRSNGVGADLPRRGQAGEGPGKV